MAIKLEVEDYCQECLDFSADVVGPQRVRFGKETALSDTIVRCEYRKRCAALMRYFEGYKKIKEMEACVTE